MTQELRIAKGRGAAPSDLRKDRAVLPMEEAGAGRFSVSKTRTGGTTWMTLSWNIPEDSLKKRFTAALFKNGHANAVIPEMPKGTEIYSYATDGKTYVIRKTTSPVADSLMKLDGIEGLAETVGIYKDALGVSYACCVFPGGSRAIERIPGSMAFSPLEKLEKPELVALLGNAVEVLITIHEKNLTFAGKLPEGAVISTDNRVLIGGLTNLRLIRLDDHDGTAVGDMVALMRLFAPYVDYGEACGAVANYLGSDKTARWADKWYSARNGRNPEEGVAVLDEILAEAGMKF